MKSGIDGSIPSLQGPWLASSLRSGDYRTPSFPATDSQHIPIIAQASAVQVDLPLFRSHRGQRPRIRRMAFAQGVQDGSAAIRSLPGIPLVDLPEHGRQGFCAQDIKAPWTPS